ncbi:hypothetical protein F5146DRAFT_1147170 [Armillaria mellea]|nr:hypothetical protein F5146DRAFT_1147170 [Armillaria mellea]
MHVDESELRQLVQGLSVDTTIKLSFAVRTLARLVNKKGVALLLHNPVFLSTTQRMLFPRRLPILDKDSDEADENEREFTFPANLFRLQLAEPGDNTFVTDSDSDQDMPPLTSVSNSSEGEEGSETDSPSLTTTNTQSSLLFWPPTPIPEGSQYPSSSSVDQEMHGSPCQSHSHVYLTCMDSSFQSPTLSDTKIESGEPRTNVLSEARIADKTHGLKRYTEDRDVIMDDMNPREPEQTKEVQRDLVLQAAKQASLTPPDYAESDSSSETSKSKSEDEFEHAPLLLNDLLWANLKNLHYVVETVCLSTKTSERLQQQPYEPYYYECCTSKSNQYRANSALSYLIRRHDDHLRNAWHYEVLENGTIPEHVFHHVNNPLEYSVVEIFWGIRDNSPLYSEDNSLLSAEHPLYDGLWGHDEWKIAMLGTKIYGYMRKMDVCWEHWMQAEV